MASSFGPWADLPPELLRIINDSRGLLLQSHCAIRGVCTAWRAALPPPSFPLLLAVSGFDDAPLHGQLEAGYRVSALPLLLPRAARAHELSALPVGGEFVGSCHGWIAVNMVWPGIFLVNPLAGEGREIGLPALRNVVDDGEPVRKIVFAPCPAPDDCTAVAICGPSTLAYIKTRDVMRGRWVLVEVSVEAPDRLADLAYDGGGGKVYCVTRCGDVHVFQIPHDRRRLRPKANPLQPRRAGEPFKPAAAFAPPYDFASRFAITSVKNVFICDGGLYQVWRRNAQTALSWMVPGGGLFRMPKDDVVVLKYQVRRRRPCWDAVNDLGGCSVFVGKNNPVVLRPEDAPGVRANCVYWINEQSRSEPMVFDMATRTSTRHPSSTEVLCPACRPLCWYFLQEKTMSVEDN
ncbi:hypothetical protein EJB05_39159, partial [Eragrostis curvula]